MDGETVLLQAVDAYRAALGDRLLAAYALGSLAHGGFSEWVSDVDLGLIVCDPLQDTDAATVQAVADREKRKGTPLHERLSVFWGTPSTLTGKRAGGRFPPLDRLDLIESGRLLAGEDAVRPGLPRPSASELVVTGAEFALEHLAGISDPADTSSGRLGSLAAAGEEAIEELRSPQLLAGRGVRHVTKQVLFPVRFMYTAATGDVGTNDAAVEHYLAQPAAASPRLVQAALAWRSDPPGDQPAVARLLGEQIVRLYVEYIDDHIPRLESLGGPIWPGRSRSGAGGCWLISSPRSPPRVCGNVTAYAMRVSDHRGARSASVCGAPAIG